MGMANHSGSAIVSLLIAIIAIGVGQVLKNDLSATKAGTLLAGSLGSIVFVFLLTAMSNFQMASIGEQVRSGLIEVTVSLVIALIVSASIHRVAFTVCLLFSIFFLFLLTGISQSRYAVTFTQQPAQTKKKK